MAIIIAGNNTTYWCLHAKCPTLLPDVNLIWIFSTDFSKVPSSSRTDTCRQTDGHGMKRKRAVLNSSHALNT